MYQVIIVYDETRERSYYWSYVVSEDTTLGNIECSELPPYADINMARACYWDEENLNWVFDDEKYEKIVADEEAQRKAREEEEAIEAATPSNYKLMIGMLELANITSTINTAVAELGGIVSEINDKVTMITEKMEE